MRTLVWFRGKDLRVSDHEPLTSAVETSRGEGDVVLLFVLDPFFFSREAAAEMPHRMQFLLESLTSLAENLAHLGGTLLVVPGKSYEKVPEVARALAVERVVAQAWTEPFGRERDRRVRERLSVPFELMEGERLAPHGTLRTGQGHPFSVYTPFSRAFARDVRLEPPKRAPRALPPLGPALSRAASKLGLRAIPTLEELGLRRNPGLVEGGERAARARLGAFVESRIAAYADARDLLGATGTSRLSQDLKFGTLSPRQVWAAAASSRGPGPDTFRRELVWREFAHHILDARPDVLERPFKRSFEGFPYVDDPRGWEAWITGKTGYPVVDAAARELLATGYVHNRARMIAASFLTKHLRISYRAGEAHYMKYLTDGDWAQNDAGWQWSSGSGCDAQPYFRVFAPVTQGEKFDADGAYVKRWVPELAKLDARHVHAPWEAPPLALRAAGIELGKTYPFPIVDHAKARDTFLSVAKAYFGTEGPPRS